MPPSPLPHRLGLQTIRGGWVLEATRPRAAALVAIASLLSASSRMFTTSDGGRTASCGLYCPARSADVEPSSFLHPCPSSVTTCAPFVSVIDGFRLCVSVIPRSVVDALALRPYLRGKGCWADDIFGCAAAHAAPAFCLWRGLSLGPVGISSPVSSSSQRYDRRPSACPMRPRSFHRTALPHSLRGDLDCRMSDTFGYCGRSRVQLTAACHD